MTVVRLHRHAPEAHHGSHCAVCGTTDASRLTDHVQIGPPGTPAHDDAVCDNCGGVLDNMTQHYGGQLTMMVDEAQHDAGDQNVTVPGAKHAADSPSS